MFQIRLQKYLSYANVASRRKAEELIRQGFVTINGTIATLGSKVDPLKDSVKLSGKRIFLKNQNEYYLVNKPQKIICTSFDPEGRSTIFNLTGLSPRRFFSVGRLDYQSEGALLLTNDGALAHALTHPKFNVPKVYRVKVKGDVTESRLSKLTKGVPLEDGKSAPAKVEFIRPSEQGGWLRLTITEGRNRQVRRMLEKVKLRVSRLKREAFAGLSVKGLQPGECRKLSTHEINMLKKWLN
ncbi:MAG: hypothetical protein A3F16_02415 [Deltaproteobacteria bacterium RIFCSPHIGHO2_12_FULL_43_9]|nr:MAG: hypothetical protein A3F16_02415 [Deltaproteobacteria bacterium RIFCSPHIGHO2_12_FULL_43_9]